MDTSQRWDGQFSVDEVKTRLKWQVKNDVLYLWGDQDINNLSQLLRFIDQHRRRISGTAVFAEYVFGFQLLDITPIELHLRCEPIPTFSAHDMVWSREGRQTPP